MFQMRRAQAGGKLKEAVLLVVLRLVMRWKVAQ
jgi:hypothetical protein